MTRLLALLLVFPLLANASDTDVDPAEPQTDPETGMPVVTVTGVYSGPALWKVSVGARVLWILGEVSPYPRKWKWKSKEFDQALRSSQELLIDFSGYWRVEESERSTLHNASKLPEGTSLKDVISPQLHARVTAVADKFGTPSLEPWHPFAATNRLVSSVMQTLDLTGFSARFSAARLGKLRHRKVTIYAVPELPFEERLRDWQHPSNGVCLAQLMDVIGDGGAGVKQLGNAWAVGDIAALRELVPKYSFSRDGFRSGKCAAAMHGGERQAEDYRIRRTEGWVKEAERALKNNRTTLAVVLMSELFAPDGYLQALREKGYDIVEPK